jgi:hypothetical protein
MIPNYFKDLDSVKHRLEIVSNFKSGLTIHLLGFHKIELAIAKNIICTLASNQYVNNSRNVAQDIRGGQTKHQKNNGQMS